MVARGWGRGRGRVGGILPGLERFSTSTEVMDA